MSNALRVLMLEDEAFDSELIQRELCKAFPELDACRVDNEQDFLSALEGFHPDIVLCDYHLPGFDGMSALSLVHRQFPDLPFIFVSGAMGEELAIETLHRGASDYVLKHRLSKLVPSVKRALQNSRERQLRSQAEAALAESEERFRNMADSAQDGIAVLDVEGTVTYWNPAAARIFGYAAPEVLGRHLHHLVVRSAQATAYEEGWRQFRETGKGPVIGKTFTVTAVKNGGGEIPLELSISSTSIRGKWHAIGIVRDISERLCTEAALRTANRFLKTLSRCNESLIQATDEQGLVHQMCQVAVEVGGFSLAWVGLVEDQSWRQLRPVAAYGAQATELAVALSGPAAGAQSPIQAVLGTGRTETVVDTQRDQRFAACRNLPGFALCRSAISLPLRVGGAVIGTFNIYSEETGTFSGDEVTLLEELAADLAFGIATLRMRHERELSEQKLKKGLEATVRAIAATIEARDPYTAGHQRRVAQLASAIGHEMGMPADRIAGLERGGEMHDIGKINVPSEILSRPGRLMDYEFALIQVHPQIGYGIVKDIDFPWPIAAMILQHHERLDGSGYPNRLKGDEIILEAKILVVADVVDAMTSHRPYRAALGLEASLEEIDRHKGVLYDAQAVDCCTRLFREARFSFG